MACNSAGFVLDMLGAVCTLPELERRRVNGETLYRRLRVARIAASAYTKLGPSSARRFLRP